MKSPDGRYEVVQHNYGEVRMGSPLFGQLEIRGSSFGTVPGEFAEPVAFSPDSRFLAAAELLATTSGPAVHVIVFDFQRGIPITVHSFTGFVRHFNWEPDGVLTATTWSHILGEETRRVWSPSPLQPKQSSSSIRNLFKAIQIWLRRRRFREGRTLSRFIACDVRRDILIVSAAKIEEGIITGRIRTTNMLYLSGGLIPEPEFEPATELSIEKMWDWTGQRWGGLPDGTSLVNKSHQTQSD